MSKHEQFEEWCALSATGQLTSEEEELLGAHLEECQDCRMAKEEYALVFRELPCSEPANDMLLKRLGAEEFRNRFLERARAEGGHFSPEALAGAPRKLWTFPNLQPVYQWAGAGLVVGLLVGGLGYRSVARARVPATNASRASIGTISPQHKQAGDLAEKLTTLEAAQHSSDQTIALMKGQNGLLAARVDALEKQLETTTAEKHSLEQTASHTSEMNAQLAAQVEEGKGTLNETRAELEKARSDRGEMAREAAAANAALSELSQRVKVQSASLEQDRALLTAGRDITDLMGARSLHVVDVYDGDGTGKNRKSFGRVFYTEGKSLIFYAFDLDERKVMNANYSYKAWGERQANPLSVKSLGMLYVDDKSQKRWVLKVDDPEQLTEIDSVFVTLEPEGGSDKPHGQKLLFAFLGSSANHP